MKSVLKGLSAVLEPQIKDKLRSFMPDISMGVDKDFKPKPQPSKEPYEMLKDIAEWQQIKEEAKEESIKKSKDMAKHP